MAWEKRRNERYFYQSVREGGKVRKIYFGKGPAAELAAMSLQQRQRLKTEQAAVQRQVRERYLEVTLALDQFANELNMLVSAELTATRNRGHVPSFDFKEEDNAMPKTIPITRPSRDRKPRENENGSDHQRKSRTSDPQSVESPSGASNPAEAKTAESSPPDKPQPPAGEFDFRQLVEQANEGDKEAVKKLREILDSNPDIWQRVGDLAAHARLTLIRLVANGDQLLLESLLRKAEALEAELLGSSASSLERLCVGRVVSCWVQVEHADSMLAANVGNLAQAKFWSQHQDRASKRYSAALKQLNAAHQLSPATAGSKQAETATQTSAARPSEECKPQESHDNSSPSEKDLNETPATPTGGTDHHQNGHVHSRMNGHANGKVNGHGKSAEAVANGAQVKPDDCVSKTDEADHVVGSNGKSGNRILRFTGAAYAPAE